VKDKRKKSLDVLQRKRLGTEGRRTPRRTCYEVRSKKVGKRKMDKEGKKRSKNQRQGRYTICGGEALTGRSTVSNV